MEIPRRRKGAGDWAMAIARKPLTSLGNQKKSSPAWKRCAIPAMLCLYAESGGGGRGASPIGSRRPWGPKRSGS